MAFKARKTRSVRRNPVAEGRQLIASSPNAEWYAKQIKAMVRAMADDYRKELDELMELKGTTEHYAQDSKLPVGRFRAALERLQKKWMKRISRFANKTAEVMSVKVDKHSFVSASNSLKAMGIEKPSSSDPEGFASKIESFVAENVALIKSIPEEFHSKIERSVWNSLTSKEGDEQGAFGIHKAITDLSDKEIYRADFIARDQNSKFFSVLNMARLEQNDCPSFEWVHSSAGKVPRECHIAWNGRTFLTKGGPSELYELLEDGTVVKYEPGQDGATSMDIGKPGHPPNCKCRAKPKITLKVEGYDSRRRNENL